MQAATGNKLRELREAKGLQLYDIAAQVRKSEAMVSRYERGESVPPLGIALKLAALFETTVEELQFDQDPEPTGAAA